MTYEELYSEDIEEYRRIWVRKLRTFPIKEVDDLSISEIAEELEQMPKLLEDLKSSKPDHLTVDIEDRLNRKYSLQIKAFQQAKNILSIEAEKKKEEKYTQHQVAVTEAEQLAEGSVSDLTKKYDRLLTYRDKLTNAIVRYGIEPSDVALDTDTLTREDMDTLLDAALRACETLGEDKIREHLSILYTPTEDTHDQRLTHAIVVMAGSILLAPVALLALFGYMVFRVSGVYRNVEDLKIADKLMYGVDFSKFRDKPVYDDIQPVDYEAVDEWQSKELAKMDANDPSKAKEALQEEVNKNSEQIAKDIDAVEADVVGMYEGRIKNYEDSIALMQAKMDDYLANTEAFPSKCSASYTMGTKYVLGKDRGIFDVEYEIGLQNIIYADRSDGMLMFLKLMLSNAMLLVRPKQFYCTIYDPEGLGADFATFLSKDVEEYISIQTKDFQKVLDTHRDHAQTNLRILDRKDINEYNQEAESKGMVTLDYRLLIIVSGEEKLAENRLLTEFMQVSAKAGVFVWVIMSTAVPNCLVYRKPFDGIANPYPVTPELFTDVRRIYTQALEGLESSAILYRPVFGDKYIPKDKWWEENTDKGIKLNLGLQDGDPSKGYDLILGDGNPHCYAAGGTGSGKSGMLNQMLLSLITRYAPSALELVMVDFKRNEFASLVDTETHISKLPHAKIIAGTSDGDYALSIFDYLLQEMGRRSKLFEIAGVKKLETYNEKMRSLGKVNQTLPRILFVIDEFQQMFQAVDSKRLDKIESRIAQLAKLTRFCGCHMLFCSQSSSNSVPKDILDQYTMRIVLRCSSDVSNAVLGKDTAAKIKVPQGYGYSNLAGGETQDSTRYWRIPFASEDVINDILGEVNELCEVKGEKNHHAYFYDEKEQHADSQLSEWCGNHEKVLEENKRIIIMGERTTFSLNQAPFNFKLMKADGENILLYAFESVDFCNMIMTLVQNIQRDKDAKLFLNCADPDAFQVLDIESWYSEELMDIARPMLDPTGWLDALEDMIDDRKANPSDTYAPMYFMAIRWDKQLGIYRSDNYKLAGRWAQILMDAPSVDIHIILCIQLYKEIPTSAKTAFNHLLGAKGPEEASYRFADSGALAALPQDLGFGVHQYGSSETKFKIYQHTFKKKKEERELVL